MSRRFTRVTVALSMLAAVGLSGVVSHERAAAATTATATPGSLVSTAPTATTPNVEDGTNYEVRSIVQVGTTIVEGGIFTTVDPPGTKSGGVARTDIFAANATTGAISSTFAPKVNGAVDALAAGPTAGTVYIGGEFTTVNGATSKGLALLNVSTGAVVSGFKVPLLDGIVNSLVLSNGRLILGGTFTKLSNVAHAGVAAVNATTGKTDPYISVQLSGHHNYNVNCNPSTSTCANAGVGVQQLAVSPDGTQLMLVGNFTTAVDAVSTYHRDQVARILLGSASATVDPNWATQRYTATCYANAYDSYMRGVAYSPDGSYFAIVSTGGGGQPNPSSSGCDAAARFESASNGQSVQPTWMDYAGNDTLYAVAVTSSAVYVGGHERWLNNANGSDSAAAGALPRPGLAALDPLNGLPFTWNPGRNPRGAHVSVIYATSAGLWVGGDQDYIGNYQYYRGKDSFFPYTGGETLPASAPTALPANVYLGSQPSGAASSVLYRIDAGGPALQAIDNGPNWAADENPTSGYENAGSNYALWSPSVSSVTSNVPSSTPTAIFDSERWDPGSKGDGGEMQWQFPVTAGTPVEVRVYLANRYSGTSQAGQRVFDVAIDGNTVAPNLDLSGTVGNNVGTMVDLDENAPASGVVTINFTHEGADNPLVNGIEIVKTGTTTAPAPDGTLNTLTFDGTTAGTPSTVSTGASFSTYRGAFMVDNRLIYAATDGNLYSATFNGTTLGTPTLLDPYDDPTWDIVQTGSGQTYQGVKSPFNSEISQVTGLTYANGYIFYTLFGQSSLFYRYFEPESGVVGATEFTAATSVNLSNIEGLFVSGGTLYWADGSSGNLMSAAFAGPSAPGGNVVGAAVTGSATVVNSARDWRARALFLGPAQPQPPVASFTTSCTNGTCAFNAGASNEPGGTISSYAWTFGDGSTGTGVNPSHTYASAGSYSVTLTVTDANGVTATSTQSATVAASTPVASFTSSCSGATCQFNGTGSTDTGGTLSSYAWNFGDGSTTTGPTAVHAYNASGSYPVSLTVTDNLGATNTATATVPVTVPTSSAISFVGSTDKNSSASAPSVAVPSGTSVGDLLLLFASVNGNPTAVTGPGSSWTLVGSQTPTGMATYIWEKTATAADLGSTASVSFGSSSFKSDVEMVSYHGVTATGVRAFASASDSSTASHTTPGLAATTPNDWVISYWADKSSSTASSWTTPAGQTLRATSIGGTASAHVDSLLTDYAGPVGGSVPGLTSTSNGASGKATEWTIELAAS